MVDEEIRIPRMALPRSQEMPDDEESAVCAGCWFEVRDEAGKTLYRRSFDDPRLGSMRLVGKGESTSTISLDKEEHEFELLIPDHPSAASILFFSDALVSGEEALGAAPPGTPIGALTLTRE